MGIPLLVIAVLLLVFWIRAKRGQNPGGEPETPSGSNTGQGGQLPQPTAPLAEEEDEQDFIDIISKDETMAPEMDLDELEVLIDQYANGGDHIQPPSYDDDDCLAVPGDASNDQSMVPDLDLEELHDIIQQEKEKAGPRSDS